MTPPDTNELAQKFYDYWINLMKTDNIAQADELNEWSMLDPAVRDDMIEALSIKVAIPFRILLEEAEVREAELSEKLKKNEGSLFFNNPSDQTAVRACYVCDRLIEMSGRICPACLLPAKRRGG